MKFRAKAASSLPYGPFMPLAEFHRFIGRPSATTSAQLELMANGLLAPNLKIREVATCITRAVDGLDFDAIKAPESAGCRRYLAICVCRLLVATGASTLPLSERQQVLLQTYRFMSGKYADGMPPRTHENVVDALRAEYQTDYDVLKKNKKSPNSSMGVAYEALSWSGLFGYMAMGWPLARKK